MTAQLPPLVAVVEDRRAVVGAAAGWRRTSRSGCLPSKASQPKLAPRRRPASRSRSPRSASWPTSPIARSPLAAVEGEAVGVAQAERVDLVLARRRRRTGCRPGPCRRARRCGAGRSGAACRAGCSCSGRSRAGRRRCRRRRCRGRGSRRARTGAGRRCGSAFSRCSILDHVAARCPPGRPRGLLARALVLGDDDVAAVVGVVDVEQPVLRVVGREGDRQQPALAAVGDPVADVEERLAAVLRPFFDEPDRPGLLDHEDAGRWRPRGRSRRRAGRTPPTVAARKPPLPSPTRALAGRRLGGRAADDAPAASDRAGRRRRSATVT